jgi:tetratricopeptide (TPR) repeat protein
MLRRFAVLFIVLAIFPSAARAAPEQWIELHSEHFTVVTDAGEKQARHIADQFERMRWMFQTIFPKHEVDPVAPIEVIAAKNEKVFQTLEPQAYLSKGALHLAGLFLSTPDKNYVLLRLDAESERHPYASVYHEYTHLQFSDDAAWMPLWLNEGFAEFIQNTEIRNKEVLLGEPSADDILYLRQSSLIPLPVLFKVDHNSPYYHEEQKGSVFYSESWALTHFLEVTDREKGTHRMDDYFKLVSHGEDSLTAAQKAFGDLKQLQTALEFYIRASTYKQFILNSAAAPIDESTYQFKVLSEPESDAIRAGFLVGVQRKQDAQALIDEVLKADPNNAVAHEARATLAYREGDIDEARKWYGEAVKLSSTNFFAYFSFANLSMNQPNAMNDPEIEASLRKSVELNPRFFPACDLLASILASQGKETDAVTVLQGLIRSGAPARDIARAEARVNQITERRASRAKAEAARAEAKSTPGGVVGFEQSEAIAAPNPGPKHPTEPANGPKHTTDGVIREVKCSYPSMIEFRVEGAKKTVALYSNDYFKLDFTAANFTPDGTLNPCSGIEGMKAKVQYAESSDKTVDGQAISIELRK